MADAWTAGEAAAGIGGVSSPAVSPGSAESLGGNAGSSRAGRGAGVSISRLTVSGCRAAGGAASATARGAGAVGGNSLPGPSDVGAGSEIAGTSIASSACASTASGFAASTPVAALTSVPAAADSGQTEEAGSTPEALDLWTWR
jgi:hypothetical protein